MSGRVGAVRVAPGDFNLAGGATVGYGADMFGGIAKGSGGVYQTDNDIAVRDTQRLEGSAHGWLILGKPGDTFRFQLDLQGGGSSYDTTFIPRHPTENVWSNQTSWLNHGTIALGLLWNPSQTFSLALAAGGGFQFELYDYEKLDVSANVKVNTTDELTARARGHLDITWHVAPDWLSTRLKLRGRYFRLSRDSSYISVTGSGISHDLQQSLYTQMELSGRLFADITYLSWVGFEPTIYGGFDYVRLAGNGDHLSTIQPILGGGLVHPWW